MTFRCPPMPPDEYTRAYRLGRLDDPHLATDGTRVTREWYYEQLARWKIKQPNWRR